ncbi:MAG: hypothetical protein AB7G06_00290 [Bdellovibrionales bacterium]
MNVLPVFYPEHEWIAHSLFAAFKGETDPLPDYDYLKLVSHQDSEFETDHGDTVIWITDHDHDAYMTLMRFDDFGPVKKIIVCSFDKGGDHWRKKMRDRKFYGRFVKPRLQFIDIPPELIECETDDDLEALRRHFCTKVAAGLARSVPHDYELSPSSLVSRMATVPRPTRPEPPREMTKSQRARLRRKFRPNYYDTPA